MNFHISGFPLVISVFLLGYSAIDYNRAKKYNLDIAGPILVVLSWILFVWSFIADDFNLLAVYGYSTVEMPFWLKIASSWAGMAGSFVLWAFLMALITLMYVFYVEKKHLNENNVIRAYLLATLVVSILAVKTGAFDMADVSFRLPAGMGLNPLLRSFWILIHPIFTFLGYSFGIALALFVLLSNSKDFFWERLIASLAWLNLSIGIIAGAVWAYVVLGWGGYWAWDPVETAELVPWLTLTAYFHSLPSTGDGGRRLTAALTGFYTFYSSFMTKAGAQFTASVHTFEWTPSAVTLIIIHFIAGGLILALYLWKPGKFNWNVKLNSVTNTSFSIAWWSLLGLSLVSFLGIFTPIVYYVVKGGLISIGMEYFNIYSFPLTYLFLIALVGCALRDWINAKQYVSISISIFLASVVFTVASFPTNNWMANMLVPITTATLLATLYRLSSDFTSKYVRSITISTLHLAIAIILLGVALNSTLSTGAVYKLELGKPVDTPYGVSVQYDGFNIRISDWNVFYSGHLIPEGAYGDFKFKITDNGKTHNIILPVWVPFTYGCGSEPGMISKGLDDIYVSIVHADFHNRLKPIITNNAFYGADEAVDYIIIEVKYNPLIWLVWLGTAILILGEAMAIGTLFVSRWRRSVV
jgi:cytochrome c-type biogenesis protein CcmF